MKTIAALIAGLLLSVATYLGGLVTATAFSNGATQFKPQNMDTASLWTSEPMVVHRERQVLTRLPARHQPGTETITTANTAHKAGIGGSMADSAKNDADKNDANLTTANAQGAVDTMTTGAIGPGQKIDPNRQAHVEWCSRRYASYHAADNTYQPYSGARRQCVSPNSDIVATENTPGHIAPARQPPSDATANDSQAEVQTASYDESTAMDDSAHAKSCASRYHSYDPEDNSYQPYDGGPRRQCK
jgi:hypothetical protein